MDRLASMEIFVAAVEAGSFSAAARHLKVGQAIVSKSIAHMEEKLGARLLLRSSHGLALTEAGRKYFEHARRAVDEVDKAEELARGAGMGLSGRLRFCAGVTFARLHVMPRLPEFMSAHPDLSVDAILDDRNTDLLESGADVALRMGTLADASTTTRHIAQGRRILVATPAYLARAGLGDPRSPQDLLAHEVVTYSPPRLATWPFRKGDIDMPVALYGRLQSSASEGVRAAVLADFGIALALEWMFAPELADGTVRQLLPDWELPPIDLWAVFPSGRIVSAKAQAFVSFVASVLATTETAAPASLIRAVR
ncbi:LysR family transcriptional regulator [Variovorax sp. J22R133]|nr:LysR family transcriptional regulator [Variovorax sp. J22R133]MDM0111548.1 LysR family transcriptional regulator [Variovorax sp. J22R133]